MPPFDRNHQLIHHANTQPLRWDIFCRVIDNFGDAGVCWRLARALADDYHQQIQLYIDDPDLLLKLCPTAQDNSVKIVAWTAKLPNLCEADVVIEAFACELPVRYLASMAERSEPPCWINLEYLSAEAWVEECHGLASPHPSLLLNKHFFFPGFSEKQAEYSGEILLLFRKIFYRSSTLPIILPG